MTESKERLEGRLEVPPGIEYPRGYRFVNKDHCKGYYNMGSYDD